MVVGVVMLTETGNMGFTTIVIALDVAGFPEVQGSEEVSMQFTRSPFRGAYVKTWLFVPAEAPLTFHW